MTSHSKFRIFLTDDHPIVRRGLQLMIALEKDLAVCGEADSAPAALEKILDLKPDLAVVDLVLKSSSGLELIKQLRCQMPKLKLLAFSMHDEGFYAERALRAGANGYVSKEEGTEMAINAIHQILQGKTYVSERMAGRMADRVARGGALGQSALEQLSDRELEVLEMLGDGLGSREIAERLRVSIKTVESHREHIKSKLGLAGASELVRYAINWRRPMPQSGPG